MSSYRLMIPGVRSSLVFSGFGLKPPVSGFQSYSYSSLKTSPSVTSKVVPSVLASSVCWSLQCLISTLTQGGWWWTLFLGSLVQSHCGEGGTLQTNNTHVLAVPQSHWACPCSRLVCPPCPHRSGSRLLHQEPSEASPWLSAPPRFKPLRFRRLGSPQR